MKSPNPALLKAYGTDRFWRKNLEKTSQPVLLQAAAPMSFMGIMEMERRREEQQALEAMMLNQMFRQAEAERMAATQQGFRGQGMMLSDEGNAAQQLRQMQAYQAMMQLSKQGHIDPMHISFMRAELEKEAGLGQIAGGALGSVGKLFGQAGRRMAGTATQRATGMAGPLSGVGMGVRRAGVGMQQTGQQWARQGFGPTGRFQQAAAKQGIPAPRSVGPYRQRPPVTPSGQGTQAVAQQASSGARAAAEPSGANLQQMGRSLRNRALLYGGGAALVGGAGYTGYKGLQAAKDYMMQPTYASQAWGGQGMMGGTPNQYGYQDVYY